MFTTQEILRYSKQLILDEMGQQGQQLLKDAKVLVIGAGGLGCPILQYLNAVGVGTVGIAEFDVIEASNLHRQILYSPEDIGKKKAVVAIAKLNGQNPFTKFNHHDLEVDKTNVISLIEGYDLIIDGCDNFATRYAVNDACVAMGKPLIYGSILGFQGQAAIFNHNGGKNLRDIFPEPPDADDVPSCADNGVVGTVPGIIGVVMAQFAVNIICGIPTIENQLLLIDVRTMERIALDF
jgi:adenylyltransferase/sulfurtransferase